MGMYLKVLFLCVLNMSATASYVVLAVMIARLFLKKLPKIFSYSLWAVVLFRLIIPFSFTSAFSLLTPFSKTAGSINNISLNSVLIDASKTESAINNVNTTINGSLPVVTQNPGIINVQVLVSVLSIIWISGIILLVGYSLISYIYIKYKVSFGTRLHDNIYECEGIETPFVLGIIKPLIYLPVCLNENEKKYILKHEQTHIKRLDYLVKPLAFSALCIHWFNPLVWIGFKLMCRDMEMSCDEKVIREIGSQIKKEYTQSLLSMSIGKKLIAGSPLAFGENSVKARIKNVLDYRRPAFWVTALAVILTASIGSLLAANPDNNAGKANGNSIQPEITTKRSSDIKKVELPEEKGFSQETINEVEMRLETIASSPMTASNPYAYINAHEKEYESIIEMGEPALQYMLSEFAKGNQTDLKGHIMKALCIEMLGDRIDKSEGLYETGQDWYDQVINNEETQY
ncbi:MAG: antirepressor regulating drug resistance protein [Clostridiaceae bacterium]|nr:antirepressor regulating drug resistance protein [Clostridiaceae bacterium]